jgi:hypothetical protein
MKPCTYLSEAVQWGHEVTTRGDMMRTLAESGASQQCIDRYMQGFDLKQSFDSGRGDNETVRAHRQV